MNPAYASFCGGLVDRLMVDRLIGPRALDLGLERMCNWAKKNKLPALEQLYFQNL